MWAGAPRVCLPLFAGWGVVSPECPVFAEYIDTFLVLLCGFIRDTMGIYGNAPSAFLAFML